MTQLPPAPSNASLETYSIKEGIKVIERFFDLPLDYSNPQGEKIRVFARNLIPKSKAKTAKEEEELPYLVYLQGGPGFEIPFPNINGYVAEIHEQGYQTLWMDPRGTGLSTHISPESLPASLTTDQAIADYLKFFRADSIVKDCEAIRKILLGYKPNPENRKWTILGQSFGGFCAITYLSFHSEGLKEVYTTGGLAPLVDHPDSVYAATVLRVMKRNKIYYDKYPQDILRVRNIMSYLEENELQVSNGGRLSPNRFQHLGMDFGMHGGIDRVHQLVFRAANDLDTFGHLTYKTVQLIEQAQSFDGNPIFSILHEAIYCQGRASKWAAARTLQDYPQFSWTSVKNLAESEPIYFTGEMIFPSMFDDYANLRPLKGAAEIIAQYDGWGQLFDLQQLSKNEVKVSSVSYFDDMYVDFDLAQDTAAKIKNTEQYVTNQLVHSGLRADPKDVMKHLFQLSKREYD
ncbi:alpha/beta-hydrolase [Armillaria gallica]|uniref:Alpha/beta-hydrolase n=1 Tax=Armillaria gallica TaxID=47427 RepID=A0A2H3CYQ0_ARMGA|nr:alpha/beta-hydrolase [Armillaria gallica]